MSEYEDIIRQIMLLEDRIRKRQDSIDYFTTILSVRREETRLTHEELMATDAAYRGTFYAIRSLQGWQTRDQKRIEELKKLVPPIEYLRVTITFSIETGEGHSPFYAEVTCDTVIPRYISYTEQRERIQRIINAVIKLFWIIFDSFKEITKDVKVIWGVNEYNDILKTAIFFQKYADEVQESAMDNLINRLIAHGALKRAPDEYVTRQSLIKIGVEFHYASMGAEPSYPRVHVLIEKGADKATLGEWTIEKHIIIADTTNINILKILNMEVET